MLTELLVPFYPWLARKPNLPRKTNAAKTKRPARFQFTPRPASPRPQLGHTAFSLYGRRV